MGEAAGAAPSFPFPVGFNSCACDCTARPRPGLSHCLFVVEQNDYCMLDPLIDCRSSINGVRMQFVHIYDTFSMDPHILPHTYDE
jgi:hypothetical protein